MNVLLAHGLSGRADLPIPQWLFIWMAAAVLVISFVALGTRWRSVRLDDYDIWSLPERLSRILLSKPVDLLCSTIGVFLLGLIIWAGLFGDQSVPENIAPTFVYVIFWVGLVPASVLFGNVFYAFNPWRAVGRAFAWVASKALGEKAGTGTALSGLARQLAGGRGPDRVRLARAALSGRHVAEDDRGGGPSVLGPDVPRHGPVRRRAVDPAGGGVLRVLRPLLPHLDLRP